MKITSEYLNICIGKITVHYVNRMLPYSNSNYLSCTVSIVQYLLSYYCGVSTQLLSKLLLNYCSVEMKLLSNYCTIW